MHQQSRSSPVTGLAPTRTHFQALSRPEHGRMYCAHLTLAKAKRATSTARKSATRQMTLIPRSIPPLPHSLERTGYLRDIISSKAHSMTCAFMAGRSNRRKSGSFMMPGPQLALLQGFWPRQHPAAPRLQFCSTLPHQATLMARPYHTNGALAMEQQEPEPIHRTLTAAREHTWQRLQ